MSAPGTDAQSLGGKTGPVLSAGLQRTPLPGGGGGGGERTLPLPPPRPPARPRAPARAGRGPRPSPPAGARAGSDAPARDVGGRPRRGRVEPSEVSRLWRPGQAGPRRPEPDVVVGVGVWVLIPERWEAAWKPVALRSPRSQPGIPSALERGRRGWCGSPGACSFASPGLLTQKLISAHSPCARELHGRVHHLGRDLPGSHL